MQFQNLKYISFTNAALFCVNQDNTCNSQVCVSSRQFSSISPRGWFRPGADGLLIGIFDSTSVPRVLSEKRREQKDNTSEKTGERYDVQLKVASVHGIECDSCETEYAYHAACSSHEWRHFLLFIHELHPVRRRPLRVKNSH